MPVPTAGKAMVLIPFSAARRSEFRVEARATYYTVVNTGDARGSLDLEHAEYAWTLTPPTNDPTCNEVFGSNFNRFFWFHGNVGDPIQDNGCHHDVGLPGSGHQGDVDVVVKDENWQCAAGYTGTQAADGSPTGDGPDGDCTKIAPPPKAPDCDDKKAAFARAEAALRALKEELRKAEAARENARDRLIDAYDHLNALGTSITESAGLFVETAHDRAFAAVKEAQAAVVRVDTLIEGKGGLKDREYKAEKSWRTAKQALEDCLEGKSLRRSIRRVQTTSSGAVCGSQQVALAQAQARLSVHQSVSRAFGRIDLAGARSKLLNAQRLLVDARTRVPAGSKTRKLEQALGRAEASLGRAAAAIGKLDALGRSIAAKVKPEQRQVAKAKAALAACQK